MLFFLLFLFSLLLANPLLVAKSIQDGLYLFGFFILPSLFMYLVIIDLLIKYNISNLIGKKVKRIIGRIFKIQYDQSAFIVLSSFLVGNPTSTKSIMDLIDKKVISTDDGNSLIGFNHYFSIGFIITYIGGFLYNDMACSLIILISCWISNIIIGILGPKRPFLGVSILPPNKNESFYNELLDSLNKALTIILQIGCIILFFGVISGFFKLLPLNNEFQAIICGLFEASNGMLLISNSNLSFILKICLSAALLSFGGLSIHLQVYNLIKGKLLYFPFLIKRIIAMILSFFISLFLIGFYKESIFNYQINWNIILLIFMGFFIIVIIFINTLKTNAE